MPELTLAQLAREIKNNDSCYYVFYKRHMVRVYTVRAESFIVLPLPYAQHRNAHLQINLHLAAIAIWVSKKNSSHTIRFSTIIICIYACMYLCSAVNYDYAFGQLVWAAALTNQEGLHSIQNCFQ